MTHISELVQEVMRQSRRYPRCSREQALVYACEDVAARHAPLRVLSRAEAVEFVAHVCTEEWVDVPHLEFGRHRTRCTGWADRSTHTIGIHTSRPGVGLLLHEISHLVSRADNHDAEFRLVLLRLARRHAGIQHAGLLRSLFAGSGLDTDPVHPL